MVLKEQTISNKKKMRHKIKKKEDEDSGGSTGWDPEKFRAPLSKSRRNPLLRAFKARSQYKHASYSLGGLFKHQTSSLNPKNNEKT